MSDEIRGTIFVTIKRGNKPGAPGGTQHITLQVPIDAKKVSPQALANLEDVLRDWAKRNKVKIGDIVQKKF